ncbi:MAG: imidazole glycerol phosphate synthase subunit HisH [Deltaproteobacteria bacterium]|nr:imidazole glycerol phosphate synthase subunit HisH [Deltaproteobacteria bacterium]
MSPEVLVVPTGTANLASVLAGLRRAGAIPRVAREPGEVAAAAAVVLPGVGALAAAMEGLRAEGLVEPLRERIAGGRPTLAVCLGLQLLAEGSEESPGVMGLAAVPGVARRLPDTVRVPQMGWNRVSPAPGCALLEPGWAYFANSYALAAAPPGWRAAWTEYGGPLVAAMERGALLACQFHPELSGAWGAALLARWVHTACGGGA